MLPVTQSRNSIEQIQTKRLYLGFVARRYLILAVVGFGLITLLGRVLVVRYDYFRSWTHVDAPATVVLPPLYSQYHVELLRLPQHKWDENSPRQDEKFFYVAGHNRACGWGNAMGELLLNAYIANKAGRSFVFANYTWNDNGSLYSEYNGKKIPSQIPYSAIIRGPVVGDPFPPDDHTPLSVSRDYFEKLCPKKTTIIREAVHDHLSSPNDAKQVVDGWVAKLATVDDPCVQSSMSSGQLFNFPLFGDAEAMVNIWPEFSAFPILTQFRWSALIEQAFDANRKLFTSSWSSDSLSTSQHTSNIDRYTPLSGLLAIHVRLGDFDQHCDLLAKDYAGYTAFNALPGMLDRFTPPPRHEGEMKPQDRLKYRHHCYPSLLQIVSKVREVRKSHVGERLRRVFIMTNGSPEFVRTLKSALWQDSSWDAIASSRDLMLNWEQKYIAQAVDMLIGQRAQVFIGNGFSTLTSNVVMMRMANRLPLENTRLW